MTENPPRTAIITCAVLETEIEHFAAGLPHIVRLAKLPQGLHLDPPRLRCELQAMIDLVEEECAPEAIVLGYGLCSRGTEGVRSRHAKLVIARAHDCITLLLGSKDRYADYVRNCPGTYWYSPGWNRHHVPPGERRYLLLLKQYEEQYGEDNAEYLMEMEQHWFNSYDRATYVDLGVSETKSDVAYTRECAQWLGWKFDRQRGSSELISDLLNCKWDESRFLVARPNSPVHSRRDHYRVSQCELRSCFRMAAKHSSCLTPIIVASQRSCAVRTSL
jgi:hypothetical protein